jgi:hypothetical protein
MQRNQQQFTEAENKIWIVLDVFRNTLKYLQPLASKVLQALEKEITAKVIVIEEED